MREAKNWGTESNVCKEANKQTFEQCEKYQTF